MPALETPGMSHHEREFLRSAATNPSLWKAVLTVGCLFVIGGFALTLIRFFRPDLQVGSEGLFMLPGGLFMVLYANLLRGGHEYLRRNGLLEEARNLKRRGST
jgi:hypothetical protein